jgi:hypothetical protein
MTLRFCFGIGWRSWFSLKGKVGIQGSEEGQTSYVAGSLQQRRMTRLPTSAPSVSVSECRRNRAKPPRIRYLRPFPGEMQESRGSRFNGL